MRLCKGFIEAEGPLSTPQLAQRAMKASGLDAGDKVLAKAITLRIVHAMRGQEKRHKMRRVEKLRNVCVWGATYRVKILKSPALHHQRSFHRPTLR
jgi:hypothetical protein